MGEMSTIVRSLLISIGKRNLLVPTAVVAEIVPLSVPAAVDNAPAWLLGRIAWRGLLIPLAAFESMQGGGPAQVRPGMRVAIMNTLSDDPVLPFYALVIRGIPHMVQAGSDSVMAAAGAEMPPPLAEQQVRVGDEDALIPDLDAVEAMLIESHAELSGAVAVSPA